MLVMYASVNGGVNNLQIVRVIKQSPSTGTQQVAKIFRSKRGYAVKRAENFIRKARAGF